MAETKSTNNKSTSAVSKPTASGNAITRWAKNFGINIISGVTGAKIGVAGAVSSNPSVKAVSNAILNSKPPKQTMPTRAQVLAERTKKQKPAPGCSFNLPPHAWSLPVRAMSVIGDEAVYGYPTSTSDDIHKYRRGAIWWYSTGSEISTTDDTGQVTTAEAAKKASMNDAQKKAAEKTAASSDGESSDFNYGFQFLWNPENISVAVARNMDVTPSSSDRLRSVSGAFPGQENITFSIVLDRVNDFAALRSIVGARKTDKGAYPSFSAEFLNQYKYGLSDSTALNKISMNQKLYDLSRYGTLADLEYLFKAINGAGPGGGWVTLLGKKTADIGFLSPTLLAFRFGPDSTEALSYVGWITNLSINHTMFTEEMIPLRTTVNFSVDCFAGSSII
jgi:hypothetical protein